MNYNISQFLLLITALLLAATSYAVMPPSAESVAALERMTFAKQQREQASDVVFAKVLKTSSKFYRKNGCPSETHWTVKAQVVGVLKGDFYPDDKITIRYLQPSYECVGPSRESLPTLKKRDIEAFYLTCQGKVCQPAAQHFSFMAEDEFALKWLERLDYAQRFSPSDENDFCERLIHAPQELSCSEGSGSAFDLSYQGMPYLDITLDKLAEMRSKTLCYQSCVHRASGDISCTDDFQWISMKDDLPNSFTVHTRCVWLDLLD